MRTRDLKPGFWVDERIVGLSDSAKLLFQGLWGLADREGKLEHSPMTIGFQVRPWAPHEVPTLLAELVAAGLVLAYVAGGKRYLIIPTFPKHQRFHPNEKPRGLPGPDAARPEEHFDPPRGAPAREQQPASKAGSSVPSVPSVPAGPSVPSKVAPRKKRASPPQVEKPADPRHAPLVAELVEVFSENTGATYPFTGRDAKAVADLLAIEPVPERIATVWRAALRSTGFPKVRTLPELVTHFAHFIGTRPRAGPDPNEGIIGATSVPALRTWSPDSPAGKVWDDVLGKIRSVAAYAASQLERLEPHLDGDTLRLAAPDKYFAAWCIEHYLALIEKHAGALTVEISHPEAPEAAA